MDQIKEAFNKVKKEVSEIQGEVKYLKKELFETREGVISICNIIKMLQFSQEKIISKLDEIQKDLKEEQKPENTTIPTQKPENTTIPTHIPTQKQIDKYGFIDFTKENNSISIGNGGVPTDRQTDRQTDEYPKKIEYFNKKREEAINSVDNALKILDSLDNLKKEIRLKFKRLTGQEMLIFSSIYQIEEEKGISDYKSIAKRLNLTESSVRDYIGKLIKKGIPIEKRKINNKTILLSISENLKKIASLSAIIELREI